MSDNKKVLNVPNLRFSNEEWIEYNLNENCKFCGGGTPSTKRADYWNGSIPWISSSDIMDNSFDINISREITEEAIKNSATKVCPIDSILIVSRVGVGKIGIANTNICTSQDFTNITLYNFDKLFLAYCLKNKIKLLLSQAQGTSIKGISSGEIKNLNIFAPSIKNQIKIGHLFNLIDKKIETQNKIIEHYESLIKGIRDKVFTYVEGKTIKLKDILSEYSQKNVTNTLIPVSVGKYGIRFRNEIYKKELSENLSTNKMIFMNTLIIGMGSTQIDIGILKDDAMYCVSPAYTTYKIHDINSIYLDEYLKKINSLLSKKYMIIGARQGKSVNKKELMNHEIIIHSKETQLLIADTFKLTQQKLDKEKRMLQLLNNQKTFLLSNMFI